MRKLIILTIVLILVPIVFADTITYKQIYEGEIKDSGYVNISGFSFKFDILSSDSYQRLRTKFPSNHTTILAANDSVKDDIFIVTFISLKAGNDDEFDIATQRYPLYATIKIEKQEADISMERKFEKTIINKNEVLEANVLIKNEGTAHIFDAEFEEDFPDNIEITRCVGCVFEDNKVVWKGNLMMKKEVEFSYFIKSTESKDFSTSAVLKYDSETISINQIIKVKENPLKIEREIPDIVSLGRDFVMNISTNNLDTDYNLTNFKYKITFPNGLDLVSKTNGIENKKDYYEYSYELGKNENKSFFFTLKPKLLGKLEIKEEIEYVINGIKEKSSFTKEIESTTPGLEIIYTGPSTIEPGAKSKIYVSLKSSYHKYKDIKVTIKNNLGLDLQGKGISDIKTYTTLPVANISFEVPQKKGHYEFNITAIYLTVYDETIKTTKNIAFSVGGTQTPSSTTESQNQTSQNNQQAASSTSGAGSAGKLQKKGFIESAKYQITKVSKPMWIVIVITLVSLVVLTYIIIKRTKQEISEDLTDTKLE